jgi:hypothetical protein
MTPAQQLSLEGLISRSLNGDEVAAIDLLLPERNDVAIAAIISTGRVKTQPTPIGIGTVLAVMAPSGGEFLNALESMGATDANVKWALKMIEQQTFDVGHPVTRAQLEAFAGAAPEMAAAVGALLAVAEVADPIHYNAVSDVLNIAEGRLTP